MLNLFSRLALIGALAFTAAGCAETVAKFKAGYDKVEAVVTSEVAGTVTPRVAVAGMATYDGLVVIATEYQSQPRCTGTNGPLCRDPAYRTTIDGAVLAGRKARNDLKAFMRAHPGQATPSILYDAVIAANNTLDSSTAAYRAAVGK